MAGWFEIPDNAATGYRWLTGAGIGALSDSPHDGLANPEGQDFAANSLCALASTNGVRCAVISQPGWHDWPFAALAFDTALPWLAGQCRATPLAPRITLPGLAPEHSPTIQAASPGERPEGK